jgi:putative NIF3 family GTP cyclohydrolase 1 type 2
LIGLVGRSAEGIPFARLRELCAETFEQDPFVWDYGPDVVHSVAVISGGAPGDFSGAIALGVDAFLTGETAEHVMADARENGVHFIAGGHYATERLGIRRVGELVAERFRVEHQFVEIPNPI